jgi:protein-S-isoprenylcysteine O-methyltransferase Ste14
MMNNAKQIIHAAILTLAAGSQMVLAIMLYNAEGDIWLINTGWGVMMLSAIFGWLPIFTFRRKGRVQGRGYIHTTVLVDHGVYGIVRHPQYLAGILLSVALPMISQHWLVIVPGVVAGVMYIVSTFIEEENSIEKFGDEYRRYRERVPRLNVILGIARAIRRKRQSA